MPHYEEHHGRKFYWAMYLPTEGGGQYMWGQEGMMRSGGKAVETDRWWKSCFARLKSSTFILWTTGSKGDMIKLSFRRVPSWRQSKAWIRKEKTWQWKRWVAMKVILKLKINGHLWFKNRFIGHDQSTRWSLIMQDKILKQGK